MGFFYLVQLAQGSSMLYHVGRFVSFLWLNTIPVFIFICFLYSLIIGGYLDCFTSTFKVMEIQMSLWKFESVLLNRNSEMGLLGNMVILVLITWETILVFSIGASGSSILPPHPHQQLLVSSPLPPSPSFYPFILFFFFWIVPIGTPFQYSCLENPTDRGAWWAAVHGVAKSRIRLSDFPFSNR